MNAALNDMNLKNEKKLAPSAERLVLSQLVRMAREQGLSLTGPDGGGPSLHAVLGA